MSPPPPEPDELRSPLRGLYRIGGAAALLQLIATLAMIVIAASLGPAPEAAEERLVLLSQDRVSGILRGDLGSLVVISLFLVTFPALYASLRGVPGPWAALATAFVFLSVSLCLAVLSDFSLLHLSERYAAAPTAAERSRIVAAAEAVIAADIRNSTAGFMAGLLMQGGGVMISLVMLRSEAFSRVTAVAGLLANGIDLAQHLVTPLWPGPGGILFVACGPFYLLWFPSTARDLFRLGRATR